MAKAIAPKEMPELPEGTVGWRRSSRRGSMFHAHVSGFTACRSIYLDRDKSIAADSLGDMQFWGVCPRCLAKAAKHDPR